MHYKEDRFFTDKVHHDIAVPLIYKKMQWSNIRQATEYEDNSRAIDYVAEDKDSYTIVVQERFRRSKQAANFTDFTLRYQRFSAQQHFSEFYKMFQTATSILKYFMIYGVISNNYSLERFAVINLNIFYEAIQHGTIIVGKNNSIFSKVEDNIMFAGLGFNRDKSSSFVSFDINLLKQIIPSAIILSSGF